MRRKMEKVVFQFFKHQNDYKINVLKNLGEKPANQVDDQSKSHSISSDEALNQQDFSETLEIGNTIRGTPPPEYIAWLEEFAIKTLIVDEMEKVYPKLPQFT
jgi:hypothetical protein